MFRVFYLALLFFSVAHVQSQISGLALADSLYENRNYTKAISHYKLSTSTKEVQVKMAKAYAALGNYSSALVHYENALAFKANDALLTYDYGKLLYITKQYKRALEVFESLIAIDASNPNYYYEQGIILEKLNDTTAQAKYLKVFRLDPFHQKAIYKIAKHYLIKRKHDSVAHYVAAGLKNYTDNIDLINIKAQNFYWQNNFEKAAVAFETLLSLGEHTEFIYEKLSLCYAEMYQYHKAISNRKLALQYNPNDAVAMYVIGTYYEILKDYEAAEQYITKALIILDRPLDAEYRKLATIYNRQEKYKEALSTLKKAIAENPNDEFSHFYMANTKYKYYASYDEKIKAFEDFKQKFPNSALASAANTMIKKIKEEQFKN